jgi:predicted kinase
MSKPTLYLMVGYPGAGKTTVSKIIAELSGAEHLWADKERRQMFGTVYRRDQSAELYKNLNNRAKSLLSAGKSVVFDANFNYLADREHLRQIAKNVGADTKLLWITTPEDIAHKRACDDPNGNRLYVQMTNKDFERVASSLEEPSQDEQAIQIVGVGVTKDRVREALEL